MFGNSFGNVMVVCGGLTRKQPRLSRRTQYHQLLELSVEAFHASLTVGRKRRRVSAATHAPQLEEGGVEKAWPLCGSGLDGL